MTHHRFTKTLFIFIGLLLFLLLVSFLSLKIGAVPLSFSRLLSILSRGLLGLPDDSIPGAIIIRLRLPRVFLAILVGGGLAVAGVLFQGLFRNPLVEPYTLGVSGGAALGVSLALLLGRTLPGNCFPIFGFAGAWAAVLLAYSIARRRRLLKISYLLLIGVMLSFISSALIMLLMSVSNLSEFRTIVFWAMGSLQGAEPEMLRIVAPVILLGVIISCTRAWTLNAFILGEEGAAHLGIKLEREKGWIFFLGSLLAGTAVSVAGVIGFVGLVVPHFTRLLVGVDHRLLLPASFLAGGAFLVLCDALARTLLAPAELPVGVITGVVGGSIFIYFLSRKSSNET